MSTWNNTGSVTGRSQQTSSIGFELVCGNSLHQMHLTRTTVNINYYEQRTWRLSSWSQQWKSGLRCRQHWTLTSQSPRLASRPSRAGFRCTRRRGTFRQVDRSRRLALLALSSQQPSQTVTYLLPKCKIRRHTSAVIKSSWPNVHIGLVG